MKTTDIYHTCLKNYQILILINKDNKYYKNHNMTNNKQYKNNWINKN